MRIKIKILLSVCAWLQLVAGGLSTAATPDEVTMFRAMATEYSVPMPFAPPFTEILDIAAHPDGSLVVFLSLGAGASLLADHANGHLTAVSFDEDGRHLFLASDKGLSVADAKTLQPIKFWKKINDVYDRDSRLIAALNAPAPGLEDR